jgi:hypothetical protein
MTYSHPLTRLLLVGLGLAAAAALHAQNLVQYDATGLGSPPPESLAPSAVPAFVNASDLTRGPGIGANNLTHGFSANDWTDTDSTRENAIVAGDFYELSASVTSGPASFQSIDARLRRSSSASPDTAEWQYSLDGFATDGIALGQYIGIETGGTGTPGFEMPTIDLSGVAALQGLATGTEVTFRLYAWNGSSSSSTFALARSQMLDSQGGASLGPVLSIAVVPEASHFAAFAGIVVLGFILVRRRTRAG